MTSRRGEVSVLFGKGRRKMLTLYI
jgi:hypothetical protein